VPERKRGYHNAKEAHSNRSQAALNKMPSRVVIVAHILANPANKLLSRNWISPKQKAAEVDIFRKSHIF